MGNWHNKNKNHVCEKCGKPFLKARQLKAHRRDCNGADADRYIKSGTDRVREERPQTSA